MTDRSLDPGGMEDKTPKPAPKHHMERTKLTDWKKLAKNRKLQTEKKQQTSSTGAVRPGPKPWKTLDMPSLPTNETEELAEDQSERPNFGGGVIDGGRLSGFGPELNHFDRPGLDPHYERSDNRMFKIGLGVFGAIALITSVMLSIFYIQKKKKDEQLKRRKSRQKAPVYTEYPPPGAQMYDPQFGHYPPQIQNPQFQAQFAYQQPQFGYSPAEQFYNQQAYEQNYYNMCQDYILQQRQMQMEAQMEFNAQVNPEAIMGENGYNKVMQYVDQIGENLKTPKSKRQKKVDGASTPHPIITRRAPSMKSLAQSEVSCWTEYEIENEKEDARSMDESETGSTLDESKQRKDDIEVKSDSAYGSRGSIQSPNRYRLKGQIAESQILESEHSDREMSEHEVAEPEVTEEDNERVNTLGKKTVSINIEDTVSVE